MINWTKNKYKELDQKYATHMKVVRYMISGSTAAAVDLIVLYILTGVFGMWYVISTPIAFIVAFGVSFSMQKYWTFRDHSTDDVAKQGTLYFVISAINMAINSFLVFIFTEFTRAHFSNLPTLVEKHDYLISQIVAALLIAIASFFVYQKFVFNRKPQIAPKA